jgi:hypothetical protein
MRALTKLTLLFITVIGLSARAQWRPTDIDSIDSKNATSLNLFNDEFWAPVTGMLWLYGKGEVRVHAKTLTLLRGRVVLLGRESGQFVSPDGQNRALRTLFLPPLEKPESAPLVVLLPGVFEGVTNAAVEALVTVLISTGHQVLIIPNPLSPEYLAANPVARPADMVAQAKVVRDLVTEFTSKIGNRFSRVDMMGLSYGGFLASVVAGTSPEVITGELTLLYAPLEMSSAIRSIDKMIAETQSIAEMIFAPAKTLFAKAFESDLENSLEMIQTQFKVDQKLQFRVRHYSPLTQVALAGFGRDQHVTYSNALNQFCEVDQNFYRSGQDHLFYWLNSARAKGLDRIRVLDADNDSLNTSEQWLRAPRWIDNPNYILIHHGGGHGGALAESWLSQFLANSLAATVTSSARVAPVAAI